MKRIIAAAILCASVLSVSAQEVYSSSGKNGKGFQKKTTGIDPSRLIIGGGLGLGFGTGYFYGGISPILGYRISDHFSAGISLSYSYYRNKYDAVTVYSSTGVPQGNYPFDRKSSIYTGGLWARYVIWKNIFVHVQPELLNVDDYTNFRFDNAGVVHADNNRAWTYAALVGLGIRQPITDNASLVLMVLYDVTQQSNTPYYKTIDFRIGFNIGF